MSGIATTIGLEVHVELKTATKLFCSCPVAFAGDPNSRVCPVCLGHPGTLPVPNERAIELATKIALALGCEVAPHSIFHRKNYFYPDMPKNYQISQYDIPIGSGGTVDIDVNGTSKTVRITRVHLEEDTGKSIHMGGAGRIHEADYSLEDFNRAGTPLVEIVTEPDLSSPEEARAFAQELRSILEYLEVSDVRMEEGSLRVDANVSVARLGERGTKAEIKNMNSMRSLERALAYEEERQTRLLESGEGWEQSTRHWDEKAGITSPLRTKEYAFDYRYFPEPDLTPIEPPVEWLRQLSEEIPELPAARRRRLVEESGLSSYDATVLTASKGLSDFYDGAVEAASSDAKTVANWVANALAGALSEKGFSLETMKADATRFAALVDMVGRGEVSQNQGKEILGVMISEGGNPGDIADAEGLRQLSDRDELEGAVDAAIEANPEVAGRVRSGDDKPLGFLVGQVMKTTGGKGNPKIINEILRQRLG